MNNYNFKKLTSSSILVKNGNKTVVLSDRYTAEYRDKNSNYVLVIRNKYDNKILESIDVSVDSISIDDVGKSYSEAKELYLELDTLGIFFLEDDGGLVGGPVNTLFTDDSIIGTGSPTNPLGVPKLYAHVGITNDNPVQNNTNTPVLIDTWDLDLPIEALYNVHVTVEYNINVINKDAIFRFDVNGATGININQESKDATNNIFFTTFAFDTLQAGVNTIEFYASIENPQNPSQRVEVRSNRYVARKIDELS